MCHIYIYLYTRTHMHTHSRADLTVYFVVAHESPWVWKPPQRPLPAPPHTLKHMHTKSPHWRFESFYLSKPYHGSLHSCSLSISIAHIQMQAYTHQASICIVLIVFSPAQCPTPHFKIEVRVIHSLISPNPLIPFVGFKTFLSCLRGGEDHYFCVSSLMLAFLWCKHRARLTHSQISLSLLRKKHMPL